MRILGCYLQALMKKILIIIGLYFQLTSVLGQDKVDSLDLWNFDLDIYHNADSAKSIGQISFWRTKPIDDGISLKLYGKLWTPNISYDIFTLADSAYCLSQSHETKVLSSCIGSNVGGDLFKIGNYLFLNKSVCLSCIRRDTNVDYCRPVIKYIVTKIDKSNTKTLDAIVRQFGIKESEQIKASR